MLLRYHLALSPLLTAVFLLIFGSNSVHTSITICSRPSAWSLHDLVSQLSTQNLDLNSTSSIALTNSSTSSQLNLQLISKSENVTGNVSLPISTVSEFSRRLFGNHSEEESDKDNVTLVVLTSSSERRLGTEQQLVNLEAIYQTLVGVHLTSLRFVLLNSRASFDPLWVASTRRRVSFEVYQELPGAPIIGSLLDGRNGDIFIYDRCGFLTYYIPFPLSFIHTQQPILQAAVLATYFDSPCRAKCNTSSTTSTTSSPETPVVGRTSVTEVSTSVTTTPATSSVEVSTTSEAVNQTETSWIDYSSSSSFLNDSHLLPMVNLTAEQAGNFNDMGQILMKFFGQIAAEKEQQENSTAVNSSAQESSAANHTNSTTNVEGNKSNNVTVNSSTSLNLSISGGGNGSLSVLDRLRGSQRPRLEVTTCTATVCNEWSTERLLKARLCCLNSPEGESTSMVSAEANSTVVSIGNSSSNSSASSSSSGFGCTLYARRNQCSAIMPVIRCCLRKVLNKYFDFTIRLREQQQRSQAGGGKLGSLTVDPGTSGQPAVSGSAIAAGSRDVHLEVPADYVLGGVQQSDYLKQQHRKRVNRRVVSEMKR